jgi:CHASE1-domain containing sensor protein
MSIRPKQGQFADVQLGPGQSDVFQGLVTNAEVAPGATLTVQGTVTGRTVVQGIVLAQGVVDGEVSVAPGGVAILQGVVTAVVRNEGTVVIDADPATGTVRIENLGEGRSGTFDDLPSDLRARLPTMTTRAEPS